MGFELFQKGSAPVATVPSVTIQKRGLFSLNDAAAQLLGDPEAVQFLWDAQKRLIALRAARLDEPNAYPLREQNPTKRRPDGKRGARLAAGTLFTKFIGLDTTIARRWIPRIEDSMLVIDLNEEGALVVGNRNRSRTPEKAGDEEG